jgi:hypothetical protein
LLRSRCTSSARGSSALSKYFGSGQTRTLVPRRRKPAAALRTPSGCASSPPANSIVATCPSRQTVTASRCASAFVTETPPPCNPPEKL